MKNKMVWMAVACAAVIAAAALYLLASAKLEIGKLHAQVSEQQATLDATMDTLDACSRRTQNCAAPAQDAPKSEIEKVLEPENIAPERGAKIDQLKKRYEDLLVSYFVLRKCEKINAVDYHIINSSLVQEMASINAPGRLQYDILVAAKGSYEALYAKNSCDEATIKPLSTDYKHFIDTVAEEFNLR